MPNNASNRLQNSISRKLEKFLVCRRAKRLCNEISREMAFFESKFVKPRLHHQ